MDATASYFAKGKAMAEYETHTDVWIQFKLPAPPDNITRIVGTCYSCGYHTIRNFDVCSSHLSDVVSEIKAEINLRGCVRQLYRSQV